MLKRFFSLAVVCAAFFSAAVLCSCTSTTFTPKVPVEDKIALTKFADQIAVLRNPDLPTNSKEKFEAALAIANGVDFSYIRNLDTLKLFFFFSDVIPGSGKPEELELYFYYTWENRSVRFFFLRHKDTIINQNVTINDPSWYEFSK